MSFWTDNNFEPKRAMRFKVGIIYGRDESPVDFFYVKDVTKPTFDVTVTPHKVAGREFKFPGSVKWNSVKATFVDDVSNTVLDKIVKTIADSNYPDILSGAAKSFVADKSPKFMSKKLMTSKLTTPGAAAASVQGTELTMVIEQLDAEGLTVESWSLYNPIIEKFEQDGLDYAKEELSTYSLTISYDWASFTGGAA